MKRFTQTGTNSAKKAFDECRVSSFFMFINLALHPFTQGNLFDFQMLACVVYSVSKATRH